MANLSQIIRYILFSYLGLFLAFSSTLMMQFIPLAAGNFCLLNSL